MTIPKKLAQKITDHLNPNKSYRHKAKLDIGRDYLNERDDLLLKDIDELVKAADFKNLLTWLPKIYSSTDQLFTDYSRDAAKIKDKINEIIVKIASFEPQKNIGSQKILLEYVKPWIAKETLRPLGFNVCSKLLDLRGTTATYKDDSNTLNIQHFIIKLDAKVHDLRHSIISILLEFFESAIFTDKIRILEILGNGHGNGLTRFKSVISPFAFKEIDYSIKFLSDYLLKKKNKQMLDPEFYDVLAKIYNLAERIGEYKKLGYDTQNSAKIIKQIESFNHFLLFQSLFHPNYRYLVSGKELRPVDIIRNEAEKFRPTELKTLIKFLEYAQKQGAIYNSIKTFFRELGRINPKTSIQLLESQLNKPVGSFWYYAGHILGSLLQNSEYISFVQDITKRLVKSTDTLENKAVVDLLTEIDEPNKLDKNLLEWCLSQLEKIVNLVNSKDKTNWHFKWSVTDAVENIFNDTTAQRCFKILEKCLAGLNGFEKNNQIIFDQVAGAIFGLEHRKKLEQKHTPQLISLLQYFIHSGRNSMDIDTFYQVVSKYNVIALLDFIVKRISFAKSSKSSLDIVPFNWKFIFEELPAGLPPGRKKSILEHLIRITLANDLTYPLELHLDRIWAALQNKLGRELGYEVLNRAIKKHHKKIEFIDKLLYLLQDVDDYDNSLYWQLLESQVKTKNHKICERVHTVIFSGTFSSAQEDFRKKWLTIWTKSDHAYLARFAKTVLGSLEKMNRWLHE